MGESNPYGSQECYALFPSPPNSAGARLCENVLGLTHHQYLRVFDRTNLCRGKWDDRRAQQRAQGILARTGGELVVVALGAKVTRAFARCTRKLIAKWSWVRAGDVTILSLPHPSGLCREWNDPDSYVRARKAIEAVTGLKTGGP